MPRSRCAIASRSWWIDYRLRQKDHTGPRFRFARTGYGDGACLPLPLAGEVDVLDRARRVGENSNGLSASGAPTPALPRKRERERERAGARCYNILISALG